MSSDIALLKVPGKQRAYTRGRTPRATGLVVLPQPLLRSIIKLAGLLHRLDEEWAIGGDAGELMLGVDVGADHREIITIKKGKEAISGKLQPSSPNAHSETQNDVSILIPAETEKKVERQADCSGNLYAVSVKSQYFEATLDGVRVKVYGDL